MATSHVCHFLESTRGGKLLCLNNYIMRLNFRRCGKTYWKCKTRKCSSSAITKDGNLILARENHNHEVNTTEIQLKRSVILLKKRAVEDLCRPVRDVYNEVVKTYYGADNDGNAIPQFSTVRSMLYSARQHIRHQYPEAMEMQSKRETDDTQDRENETSHVCVVNPYPSTIDTVPTSEYSDVKPASTLQHIQMEQEGEPQ